MSALAARLAVQGDCVPNANITLQAQAKINVNNGTRVWVISSTGNTDGLPDPLRSAGFAKCCDSDVAIVGCWTWCKPKDEKVDPEECGSKNSIELGSVQNFQIVNNMTDAKRNDGASPSARGTARVAWSVFAFLASAGIAAGIIAG